MPTVISRVDAHKQGLVKFFTGTPCKHGHLEERYVSTGGCKGCLTFTRDPLVGNALVVPHIISVPLTSAEQARLKVILMGWTEAAVALVVGDRDGFKARIQARVDEEIRRVHAEIAAKPASRAKLENYLTYLESPDFSVRAQSVLGANWATAKI